jgi:hypothetical protein
VRRLEQDSWALLGEFVIDGTPVGPFAALARMNRGLATEVREFISEENILREVGYRKGRARHQ